MRKERRYPSGLEHSSEAINESGARTELPNRPAPGSSLIEAIGRKEACELMQDVVLRAIEENRAFGLGGAQKDEKAQGGDGLPGVVGSRRSEPLTDAPRAPEQAASLKKNIAIA